MTPELDKDIIVFYHGMCRDGFTAAWAAWKKFGDRAAYVPIVWSNLEAGTLPHVEGKEIYFLDYCPVKEKISEIIKRNKSVTVVDHHVSREEVVKSLSGSVYDVSRSGAVLAWNYFYPTIPIPYLCLIVEDSDLWNWKITGSAAILNYIDFKYPPTFENWDHLREALEDEKVRAEFVEKGSLLVSYRKKLLDIFIAEQAYLVSFEGHEVLAVNGPRYFRSEIGNELSKRKPPFGIIWHINSDEISVSMRSDKDGDNFDLVPLASKYGGGGHRNAANFRLPLGSELPWKHVGKYHAK